MAWYRTHCTVHCICVPSVHSVVLAAPLGGLALINSLLMRAELHRAGGGWLHCGLYSVNLLLHSLLLVCGLALALIGQGYLACCLNTDTATGTWPSEAGLSTCGAALALSAYLLELNVYWMVLPGLALGAASHVAVQWLVAALVLVNGTTLAHAVGSSVSMVVLGAGVGSTLQLMAVLLVCMVAGSTALLLSTYLYLLMELGTSCALYSYLYTAYLHIIWVWGHVEVYVLCMPQLSALLCCTLDRLSLSLCDDAAVSASCMNMAAVSSLTWAHHLYSMGACADLLNLYGAVSLCMALSTAGKLSVVLTSCTLAPSDRSSSTLGPWCAAALCGGLTGVYVTLYAINSAVHCTSTVCGHCHCMLSLGCLLASLACAEALRMAMPLYCHAALVTCAIPIIVARRVYAASGSYAAVPLCL